jgi:hypothetical protein
MQVLENEILVITSCGQFFYFHGNGMLIKTSLSDSYSCKKPLHLLKLKIKN